MELGEVMKQRDQIQPCFSKCGDVNGHVSQQWDPYHVRTAAGTLGERTVTTRRQMQEGGVGRVRWSMRGAALDGGACIGAGLQAISAPNAPLSGLETFI